MTLQGLADWHFARFVVVGVATAVADVGIVCGSFAARTALAGTHAIATADAADD